MINFDNKITDNDLILVTGAGGFLGSHIVKQLQERGHRVRGSIRSLKDEKKVNPLKKLVENPKYELELVEADLVNENAWLDVVKGCTYVIHTASPVLNYVPRDENIAIKPAVEGVLNIFKACCQPGSLVKRVVFTSSIATVAGDSFENDKVYTEKDYSKPENSTPYTKSKILAEKAAWDFVKNRENCFELVVINPGYIIGPAITDTYFASMETIKRLMNREIPFIIDLYLPGVDVRTVALTHIVALTNPEAVSNRHICVTHKKPEHFKQYALWLEEEFKSKGYNIPTGQIPNFLLKFIALFSRDVSFISGMLGKRVEFDNSRLINVLKIEPLETKDGFIEMAYSMIEKGFVNKV